MTTNRSSKVKPLTDNQAEILAYVKQYNGTGQEAIVELAKQRSKSRASIYAALRAIQVKGHPIRSDLQIGRAQDRPERELPNGIPIAGHMANSNDPVIASFATDAEVRLREIEAALPTAKDGVRALKEEQAKIVNALLVFADA